MRILLGIVVSASLLAPVSDQGAPHQHGDALEKADPEFDGQPGSVTGYIRDAACLLRNPAAGAPEGPVPLECAQKCVRNGSPLVLFTAERKIYFVLSGTMPDTGQNAKFLPYVGKVVKASGRVFERDGVHAIAIQQVQVIDRVKKP